MGKKVDMIFAMALLIVIGKDKPLMASDANSVAHLVPFQLAPSVLVGTGFNLQDSGESRQRETVETIRYKGENCIGKREEKNRADVEGKERNKQFYFKTGTLGNQESGFHSVCVRLFSDCGNERSHLIGRTAVSSTAKLSCSVSSAQLEKHLYRLG